jgi:cellobiose phosphorylase
MNFNGKEKDSHFYMGSLMAAVFGSLDTAGARRLVRTAGEQLFAEGLGIRAVMPPDFHTDSLKAFFHFAGNEAGDPYRYINGGVWPHNNAWYAMALSATGRVDDAFRFYKSTMTLDGITHSPMGQPAFYEYRYSDPASPLYGEIDKPSFLWAAGFSLLAGYRVLGIRENEWNISFSRKLPAAVDTVSCALEFGGRKHLRISGKGSGLRSFTADGRVVPSLVVPLEVQDTRNWTVILGDPQKPYLAELNAQLRSATYDAEKHTLQLTVLSYKGHTVTATIRVTTQVRKVNVDGREVKAFAVGQSPEGESSLMLTFAGSEGMQKITVTF